MLDKRIYYINFSGNIGSEINSIHLGIVFSLPNVKNMLFCIPLTSPKLKHFKNKESFEKRNHLFLKYQNLVYIPKTDSIALLDQIRTISIKRVIKPFNILLDENEINILINKLNK